MKKLGGGWCEFEGQKFQGTAPPEISEAIEKSVISAFYGDLAPAVAQVRQMRKEGGKYVGDVPSDESGEASEVPREESAQ